MRRLSANGVLTAYETAGPPNAPVLVLCHSLGTSMDLWTRQWEPLSRGFRVVRYDIRGHGATSATEGDYTIATLATDLLALFDDLEIERAHFCGVSIGGLIVQWLAINAPQRLGKLVLANTAARIGSCETWNERIALVRERGLAAIAEAALGRWFTTEFKAQEPEMATAFRKTLLTTSTNGYLGCCAAIRDADLRANVSSIEQQTLVITGELDEVTTPGDAAWLAGQIPNAKLLVLPAAHLANVEASEKFNEVVMTFLSSTEA